MSALEDVIRQIVIEELTKLKLSPSAQLELDLDNGIDTVEEVDCAAELALESGHTLKCYVTDPHTTHRFSVEV